MEFKIVTPHGVTYDDTIEKVTVPTRAGMITILPNHAALVSVLCPGEMVIYKEGSSSVSVAVASGILEIRPTGEVYVMADSAERAEHIDIARAEEARMRAEELMKKQDQIADIDFARLQAKMEKELARISVGNKYRKL